MRIIVHEQIFPEGVYFPECHASTVEQLPDGSLVAAWFAGTKEGNRDVAIYTARRTQEGWSKPEIAANHTDIPCWNPVLFWDGARLQLYYKIGHTIPAWTTYRVTSADGGTWSKPEELVPGDRSGGRGPVKNKPIRLQNGDLCAPASVETGTDWDCFADVSADNGAIWQRSKLIPIAHDALAHQGIIQPTVWQEESGTLRMLMRSTEGFLYSSCSDSNGRDWNPAVKTEIPNNNSGVDAALCGGRVYLVYNPVSGNWAARDRISLGISEDGEAFRILADLDREEKAEFSYPAIIARGRNLFVTYTLKRRGITFWHLQTEG